MAFQLPSLGPRMQRVVRVLGFTVLALVTFVFAVQLTFPYERVKQRIIDTFSDKYDVTIGDVERGIMPGRVYFKNVSFKTRPTQADLDRVAKIEKPEDREAQRAALVTMIYIEKLEVDLGVFALVRGKASVDIDAKIGSGHISGNIAVSKGATTIDIEGNDLPSIALPMREAFSGLPMSGKVRFSFALDLPNEKSKAGKVAPDWSKAEGAVSFECPANCTLGDGVAKFHPKVKNARSEATVKDGIKFGKVNVDSLVAKVEIKKGVLEITKFEVVSKDVELHMDFQMNLAQEMGESMVAGCARYKPTEVLLKREPETYSAFMLIGGPLGPDTLFHVKLDGRFKELKKLALVCGPSVNISMDDPSGNNPPSKPSRPGLAPAPDETPKAIPVPIPPPIMNPIDAAPLRPPGPEHEENGSGSAGSGSAHDGTPNAHEGSAGSAEGSAASAP